MPSISDGGHLGCLSNIKINGHTIRLPLLSLYCTYVYNYCKTLKNEDTDLKRTWDCIETKGLKAAY